MVRAQRYLADELGIDRWLTVIGGSMGGMQVLEWGVLFPDRVRSLVPIASGGRRQRPADRLVGGGSHGDRQRPRTGGTATTTTPPPVTVPTRAWPSPARSPRSTTAPRRSSPNASGGEPLSPLDHFDAWAKFQVESYLDYHGDKLVRRFDANTYLVLNRAMDLHDLARGRGSLAGGAGPHRRAGVHDVDHLRHAVPALPAAGAARRAGGAGHAGRPTSSIDSPHGHDGFLLEFDQVGRGRRQVPRLALSPRRPGRSRCRS